MVRVDAWQINEAKTVPKKCCFLKILIYLSISILRNNLINVGITYTDIIDVTAIRPLRRRPSIRARQ